ncbi:MAG: twin-arginine translocase TatA/TatE family subunit [Bacteroidota bacterium]|nr:twin-arginine translocase TatA/TatE family subunit [Bacteroidota bacterium]
MLNSIFAIAMPGGPELILIFGVVLLIFGGKKIPELMKGVGKGMREFNDAKDNVKRSIEDGMKEPEVKKTEDQKIAEATPPLELDTNGENGALTVEEPKPELPNDKDSNDLPKG